MDVILKNEAIQETREVKNGPAWFLLLGLIPYIGGIIVLVLLIMKKQFKYWLSQLLFSLIVGVIIALTFIIAISVGGGFGSFLMFLAVMGIAAFSIYLYIAGVSGLNYWSYNQYIKDGYTVVNTDDIGVPEFMEKAETKTRPWWVFFL